jgi:periplasmic protein CpxP/Spy
MTLKSLLRGTAVATLLFAVPVLAQTAPTTEGAPQKGQCERGKGRHGGHKFGRMEHRLDKKVAEGRLTQAQADGFKAEARQLREEMKAARAAAGENKVDEATRAQFKERRRALHEKIKAALAPTQQGA